MTGRRTYSKTGLQLERQRRAAAMTPQQRWLRHTPVLAALLAMVLVMAGIVALGPGLTAYDRAHLTTMECTVSSATRVTTSSTSRTVSTSSGPFVEVQSPDCGVLWLKWHIGRDNVDETAARLDSAHRARFTVGEGSLNLMPVMRHVPRMSTTVYGFTKLS